MTEAKPKVIDIYTRDLSLRGYLLDIYDFLFLSASPPVSTSTRWARRLGSPCSPRKISRALVGRKKRALISSKKTKNSNSEFFRFSRRLKKQLTPKQGIGRGAMGAPPEPIIAPLDP